MKTSDVIAAIQEMNGNLAAVARRLGVTRQSVYNHLEQHATARAALVTARETMLDNAESVLYRKVLDGSTAELIFFLKTQGKSRGYTEKMEVIVEQRVREELGGRLDALANELDAETYQHVLTILSGS